MQTEILAKSADIASEQGRDWQELLGAIVLDRNSGIPLHVQLSAFLRRMIHTQLEDEEKLLPEGELVTQLGLSLGTVRRALGDLTAENLLERRRHKGTVVRKPRAESNLRHIVMIVPDFTALAFSAETLNALHTAAYEVNANMQILRLRKGQDWKHLSNRITFSPAEGGIILNGNPQNVTLDLYSTLSHKGFRTVCICPKIDHYPGRFVGVCNQEAIDFVVAKLKSYGHERVLFLVSEPEELDEVKERVRCFEESAKEHGVTHAQVYHCGIHAWENSSAAAVRAMPEIMAQAQPPTAIFAVSDAAALGVLFWCNRNDVHIPEDLSLVSFDGTELTRVALPPISSLMTPVDQVAKETIRLLSLHDRPAIHKLLPSQFQEGGTLRKISLES